MPDAKISALPAASSVADADLVPVVQGGVTKKGTRGLVNQFLSANTARVDPSGNDSTGTIGDLTKPFLTVQAALTKFETSGAPSDALIDVGNNSFTEDLTTSLTHIQFLGNSEENNYAFNSIHFTEPSRGIVLTVLSVSVGPISSDSTGRVIIGAENAYLNGLTCNGEVFIDSNAGGSRWDFGMTANGQIQLSGFHVRGPISAPGFDIRIRTRAHDVYVPDINSIGSNVYATGSLLGNVTCGILTLADSRVTGTNNATSTVYADVLLKGTSLGNFTVAALPTGTQGDRAIVTDATAPTFLGALTGGGAVVTLVVHNGTAWRAG
jgi:hypothetical protein